MRKDVRHYFETSTRLSGQELISLLERAICEGVCAGEASNSELPAHMFGRSCEQFDLRHFSSLMGMASSGVRTAGFFGKNDLEQIRGKLNDLSRQHIPLVLHTNEVPDSSIPGCFQVVASNLQEAIDWTLMAHKIAELALMPALVVCQPEALGETSFLHDSDIRNFLGEVDDWVLSPTPSQRILFGKKRRRLPNWFHFDLPSLMGAVKDERGKALETAARERFFYRHVPELIGAVVAEFSSFTGRTFPSIQSHQLRNADYLVLVQGGAYQQAVQAVDQVRKEKLHAGCIHLNWTNPFPEEELSILLKGKKALTILEPLSNKPSREGRLFNRVRATVAQLGKTAPQIYSGVGEKTFTKEGIVAALRNMSPKGAQKKNYYLDIDFTRASSSVPQHEVLLHAISRAYPDIEAGTLSSAAKEKDTKKGSPSSLALPAAIRRHKDQGPPFSKISRFYHDTASLYGDGNADELVADPFQSLPLVPPETALFANIAEKREQLPVLDTEACTGCGACFVHCPHSALPPLSIHLENLLKGGMKIASAQGLAVAPLTPMIKNLALFAAKELKSKEEKGVKVDRFLPGAFEKLAGQMKLEGEKREKANQGIAHLVEVLSGFQGIRTDKFFPGSDGLFSLTINPHSCTACGVCVEVCPEEALTMAPQTPELLNQYEEQFQLWEQLPDTDSDTIERLNRDPEYDPFASILLSRYFYQSLTGGNRTEGSTPAKALLHLVTALTESTVQPHVLEWVKELDELIRKLADNIHGKLSEGLPNEDSTTLRNALLEAQGKKVPLDELVGSIGAIQHLKPIDTALLQRKIVLESNLKDLRWALTDGPNGTGRARYGMVFFTEKLAWLNDYPFQPFNVPVYLNGKDTGMDQVGGLIAGQVRYLLDQVRVIRRAKLEQKDAYRPEIHDPQIAALAWEDLDDKEKLLLPPLLVVADAKELSHSNLAEINQLLASEWPVKVLLLNDGSFNPDANFASQEAAINGILLSAISMRKPVVVQGGFGASEQLYKGLMKGLKSRGTALIHLLALEPAQHNVPLSKWPELYRIALETRAFPSLLYEPHSDVTYLSEGFNLEGNPPKAKRFSNWLQTQRTWNGVDKPLAETEARKTVTQQWQNWQELAGAISAYPDIMRAKTEAKLRLEHEEALEAAQVEYEEKLKEQEAMAMQRVKVQLREKLLALSKNK